MRLPDEPGLPALPPGQPTRDLLLAQALDACIAAERRLPGSSQEIIARQPAWARGELQRLVGLAGSLDAATSNAIMSSEFRVAARARLMQRIGGDPTPPETREGFVDAPATPASRVSRPPGVAALSMVSANPSAAIAARRNGVWVWRAAASLVAAVLAGAATLTASASALPGEPLYGLKEVREELAVRLATDDQQRTLLLLQQANARLDETTRLLQQGRTLDATVATQRYDQVVQRATTSYVGSIDDERPARAPTTVNVEASLSQDHDQLQALLQSAPEPARADLREALVATERSRALVADLRLAELPLGRAAREPTSPAIAAAVPTIAVDTEPDADNTSPTAVPAVLVKNPTAIPTRLPALALPTPTPAAVVADAQHDAAQTDITTPVIAQVGGSSSRGSETNGSGTEASPPARSSSSGDETQDTPDGSSDVNAHSGGDDDRSQADVAALINGRTAASPLGSQADRSDRRQDVESRVMAHQSQETTTVRSAPAQVVTTGPERVSTPNTSSTSNTTDRNAGYTRGEVRMSPTLQVVATKPPSTSASTSSQTSSSSSQSTSTSAQTASNSSQSSSTSALTASTSSQTSTTSSQATSTSAQISSTSASTLTTKSGNTTVVPVLRTTSGDHALTDSSHSAP